MERKAFCRTYVCGKQEHIVKNCKAFLPQKGARKALAHSTHKCYSCGKEGNIARHCPNRNNDKQFENSTVMLIRPTTKKSSVKKKTNADLCNSEPIGLNYP